MQKATLVTINEFGFPVSRLINLVSIERSKYAQYNSAVKITYKLKGKRKAIRMVKTSGFVIILKGWIEDVDLKKKGEMLSFDELTSTSIINELKDRDDILWSELDINAYPTCNAFAAMEF